MVAQLLRLKLRMTANLFRRSGWQVFGLIVAVLYGALLTVVVVAILVSARSASNLDLVRSIVVIGGSVTMLGFLLVPLIVGSDDSMDPRRFALFGIGARQLSLSLTVAALVGIPAVVLAICTLASVVTWSANPGSAILAVLAAAIAVITCTVLARIATSIAATVLINRRARELGIALGVLLIVVIAPIVVLLINIDWGGNGVRVLRGIAATLGWTPLGAVWSVPADAALGNWGTALLKLLISLAFAALACLIWYALVAKMLVSVEREGEVSSSAGLGWFGVLPHRPVGAIAARALTYWGRDPRYWVPLVMIPVVPVVAVVALLIAEMPAEIVALLPLPLVCLLLGWTIHNDVAYDSTAVWLHVSSGTRGIADRVGRLIPVLLIGVPLIAVGSIVTMVFHNDWRAMPAVIGVSTAFLLIGLGLSSLSSVFAPYPVTKPNESPFAQPQNTGPGPAAAQAISLAVILLLASPVVALGVLGIIDSPTWFPLTLLAGVGYGLIVLIGGVLAGAAVFNRRGTLILAGAIRAD